MTAITVTQSDMVHIVTKAICQRILDRADELKVLPSTRRDLAAVCSRTDTAPRYFNFMSFGEVDDRGWERTKVTLRLDFDRDPERRAVTDADGARYFIQRLRVHIETFQSSYTVETMRQHIEHLQIVTALVAEIESRYSGRDLYLLLATAEEAKAQEVERQRAALSYLIATAVSGLRVGQTRQVPCDVAEKLPGIVWPSNWVGIATRDRGKVNRTYDVSVGNVGLTVTRTT